MIKYFKLMRVHHYVKNLLVFVALFCSKNLFNANSFVNCILAFFSFSLMASTIYIINDIKDIDADSKHPTKSRRLLAAKLISIKCANRLAILLFILSLVINLLVFNPIATILLILYFLMNIAYSFKLKNFAFIDVFIISLGYIIRILYGALIINIEVSTYLYLITLFISLYLAFGKRKNELKNLKSTRKSLQNYSVKKLSIIMNVFLVLANIVYFIWSIDESTRDLYNSNFLWLTSIIIIIITVKYNLRLNNSIDGDPVEILFNDKILTLLCVLYCAVMTLLLYI